MTGVDLSLVIPLINEQESLTPLVDDIAAVAAEHGYRYEVVLIDDGSRDDSWAVVTRLAEGSPHVRGIRFRRNFGKAAALQAGFDAARGTTVVTMDADLQDDPREIPRFLDTLAAGYDVVSGWKKVRHDPWHKVFPSRVFNGMVSRLTGVKLHDHNCGFKAYRREVLSEVRLYGELHRFVPVLAAARGFRVTELVVHHRPRQFGRSKFGWQRTVKGFFDLVQVHFVTAYGYRPLHALGAVALACFGLAGLLIAGAIAVALTTDWAVLAVALTIFAALGIAVAAQAILTGLLAELVVSRSQNSSSPFAIRETAP